MGELPKTMTPALLDRLRKACLEQCRKGRCTMVCEVRGAAIGWCRDVWDEARRG